MQFKKEIIINAPAREVFKQYENVAMWKSWDAEVKESSLEGKFKVGSKGILKPAKGPKANFELTEVTPDKSFTSQTKLPLCKFDFKHQIEDFGEATKVIHTVVFSGLTSAIFGRLIGSQIKKTLPDTLKGLKASCE